MRLYTTAQLLAQSSNIIQRSFSGNLLRIEPNGNFPIFGLSGLAKKRRILALAHSYYTKRAVFPKVQLDGAIGGGGVTTFVCDDTSEVKAGSLLLVYKVTAGTYTAPELIRVTSVDSGTQLTVVRGVGGTTAAAIADNTVLIEVGNSYGEGSNMPTARSISAAEHTNFTHIFRDSWDVTRTAMQVAQEPGIQQMAENKEDAAFFHAQAIEWATLFSRKQATTDPATGHPMRYMDGVESLIIQHAPNNVVAAGATTTFKQLETMLHPTLDFKTNRGGSNTRTIYAGSQAFTTFGEIGRASGYYELQADNTVFGTQFKRFRTTRGNWDLVEHPLLNSNDNLKSMALVADMSSFDYLFLQDTMHQETAFDTNGRDAKSGVFTTELTMELTNPLAWGIIYNLQAAA